MRRQVVLLRAADGSQEEETLPAGTGIGEHRASFDARFRNMTPFGVATARYVSEPPPALTSEAYAAAFDDVKRLGVQDGDAERNEISTFWLADAGPVRETGMWLQAALAIVARQRTDRDISRPRLFALLGMTIADGVTVSWATKAEIFHVASDRRDPRGGPFEFSDVWPDAKADGSIGKEIFERG